GIPGIHLGLLLALPTGPLSDGAQWMPDKAVFAAVDAIAVVFGKQASKKLNADSETTLQDGSLLLLMTSVAAFEIERSINMNLAAAIARSHNCLVDDLQRTLRKT